MGFSYFHCFIHNQSELSKASRYILIGGGSWCVDILAFIWLEPFSGYFAAHTCSRICGAVFGFWGQKLFSFKEMSRGPKTVGRQTLKYCLLWLFSYALSVGILSVFHAILGFEASGSKIATEILVLPFNYLIMSRVIFKKRK